VFAPKLFGRLHGCNFLRDKYQKYDLFSDFRLDSFFAVVF